MTDLERIQLMQDCNWKPASQYWYERYLEALNEVQKLKQQIQELESNHG